MDDEAVKAPEIPKTLIANIIPKKIAQDIQVNLKSIEWMIDPIQSYTIELKKQKLPIFAEALSRNLSGLYYQFLEYKVKLKENITLECKGVQRSGKTTGMISTAKYISRFTTVPFIPHYVCSNEQYYIQRVKNALDNQSLVIDEQLETHVGIGSYREMQYIEDLQNIIAKRCVAGDTKILTSDGIKNIESLSGTEFKVPSLNVNTMKIENQKAVSFSTGKDELYEIITKNGNVIHATLDHELYLSKNGKIFKQPLKNILIGDMIVTIK
jgi:hypothetical protein